MEEKVWEKKVKSQKQDVVTVYVSVQTDVAQIVLDFFFVCLLDVFEPMSVHLDWKNGASHLCHSRIAVFRLN